MEEHKKSERIIEKLDIVQETNNQGKNHINDYYEDMMDRKTPK